MHMRTRDHHRPTRACARLVPCAQERALPPDAAALSKQRRLVHTMAAHAHGRGGRSLAEADVLGLIEPAPALQEAWALLRRKLARGALPLFTILTYHPLQFQLAHLSLQEVPPLGCWFEPRRFSAELNRGLLQS